MQSAEPAFSHRALRGTLIGIALVDAFDAEGAFLPQRGHVGLNRVIDAAAVISTLELWHQALALDLAYQSIWKVTFEIMSDLSKVLTILNSDQQ